MIYFLIAPAVILIAMVIVAIIQVEVKQYMEDDDG
jgi:hypothetical protein